MAQIRARNAHHRTASVARLQQDRINLTDATQRNPGPTPGCLAGTCPNPVMDEAPVNLCAKHVREVWQFGQGIIEDRWLNAAVAAVE